ncbi:MAG: hypothetical protein J6J59_00945, partial [Peptococcaceae bacterium]|nr:hypothetical protein [Peptococcaceae bacterium]
MMIPERVPVAQIDTLAEEVMRYSRDMLSVKLRFINPALSRLEMIPSTWPLATAGVRLLYDPVYVLHTYSREKNMPVRQYLHVILHCVFQHFYVDGRINQMLWNLSCDMAVENMITELGLDCTCVERETHQQEILQPIRQAVGALTAEKLYHYLLRHRPDEDTLIHWGRAFLADEHEAWYLYSLNTEENDAGDRASMEKGESDRESLNQNSTESTEQLDRLTQQKKQIRNQWEGISQQLQMDLETFSKSAGEKALGLMQNLQAV